MSCALAGGVTTGIGVNADAAGTRVRMIANAPIGADVRVGARNNKTRRADGVGIGIEASANVRACPAVLKQPFRGRPGNSSDAESMASGD